MQHVWRGPLTSTQRQGTVDEERNPARRVHPLRHSHAGRSGLRSGVPRSADHPASRTHALPTRVLWRAFDRRVGQHLNPDVFEVEEGSLDVVEMSVYDRALIGFSYRSTPDRVEDLKVAHRSIERRQQIRMPCFEA